MMESFSAKIKREKQRGVVCPFWIARPERGRESSLPSGNWRTVLRERSHHKTGLYMSTPQLAASLNEKRAADRFSLVLVTVLVLES